MRVSKSQWHRQFGNHVVSPIRPPIDFGASIGYRVGYDDASHFSREYKRYFGEPPIRDVQRLRQLATA